MFIIILAVSSSNKHGQHTGSPSKGNSFLEGKNKKGRVCLNWQWRICIRHQNSIKSGCQHIKNDLMQNSLS